MTREKTDSGVSVAAVDLFGELERITAVLELATTNPESVDAVKAYHDLSMLTPLLKSETVTVSQATKVVNAQLRERDAHTAKALRALLAAAKHDQTRYRVGIEMMIDTLEGNDPAATQDTTP